jgi:hypothetical protein
MTTKTNRTGFQLDGDNIIIYVVVALPGGCDGMDNTNRGGPVWAFTTEDEAKKRVGRDTRYKIVPKVVNGEKIRLRLKKKLTLDEKLVLKIMGADVDRPHRLG